MKIRITIALLSFIPFYTFGEASLVAPNATAKKLADGFKFTEGPAISPDGNIYFSDIPNARIHKWDVKSETLSTHREESGRANGLMFHPGSGALFACEGGSRRISKQVGDRITTVIDTYEGKKLNSPNDIDFDRKGGFYFTDPRYGKRDDLEQDVEGVYYVNRGGEVKRVIDQLVRPNGLVLSLDRSKLYVDDNGDQKLWVYDIQEDGSLKNGRMFVDLAKHNAGGGDGMTIDEHGNVYVAGKGAVYAFHTNGKLAERIEFPESPANCVFGGPNNSTLYATARKGFYSMDMAVKGRPLPEPIPSYTVIHSPTKDDPLRTHIYQLENGLTVYLTRNPETPKFYAEVAVRAGSKHDPSETTGLAHYLEHLMFKGTQKLGSVDWKQERPLIKKIIALYEKHFNEEDPEKRKAIYEEINEISQQAGQFAVANEIDKLYNAMGAFTVNAHCSNEETVYKVGLPANRFNQWAAIESERFINPVFRLFHTELETVYEEKNRSIDNKDRAIWYAMNKQLFKVHPYGQQPTLGLVEHLKNPSIKNIHEFYDTYYVPNNMAICISGDIFPQQAIRTIARRFSRWKAKELPEVKTWKEPKITQPERFEVKFQGEPYVMLGFPTVPHGHEDQEALAMLDMIMDNSTAGMINLNLNQQQRVRQAGSYPYIQKDAGVQFFWGVPKDGQTHKEVEELIIEQLQLVKEGKFEDWLIPAVLNDFKKKQKQELENNIARVTVLRDSFLMGSDYAYTANRIKRMEKIGKADVVRVAKKYFGNGYVAGYRVDEQHDVPGVPKPAIDPISVDPTRQSDFAKKALSMPARNLAPQYIEEGKDYQRKVLAPGVTIYHSTNPLNDLFNLRVTIDIGRRHNNKLPFAALAMDKAGTGSLSSEELKKEWYKLGSEFNISVNDNNTVISISGLDENLAATLNLVEELIIAPNIEDTAFEELKKIVLVQRADEKKNPQSVSRAVTLYNRYGEQSRYLTRLSDEAIKTQDKDQLLGLIRELFSYKHRISYTGKLSLDKLIEVLPKDHLADGELEDTPDYAFLRGRSPRKTEIYFYHKEMAQAQVRIEFIDGKVSEKDHTAIELYNMYFDGGMSGLVFQELREARGLAYSTGARYITGLRENEENIMVGVIGTQADKTTDALEAFIGLFDEMPESEDRFVESMRSLENQYLTDKTSFRQVIASARSWEELGLQSDPRKARLERLQKAKFSTMLKFVDKRIKDHPKLISIVGDKTKIDMEALARFGKIIQVTEEQVFN